MGKRGLFYTTFGFVAASGKKIVGTTDNVDWCVFGENGSDVTSYAITLARIFTGKMDILLAAGSYHGSHFWCQPHGQGFRMNGKPIFIILSTIMLMTSNAF